MPLPLIALPVSGKMRGMTAPLPLFDLNPALDAAALAAQFAATRRLQIRDLLTERSAEVLADVVQRQTPYGLAWREAGAAPQSLRAEAIRSLAPARANEMWQGAAGAVGRGEYGFVYSTATGGAGFGAYGAGATMSRIFDFSVGNSQT